jgi:hypothetical protein
MILVIRAKLIKDLANVSLISDQCFYLIFTWLRTQNIKPLHLRRRVLLSFLDERQDLSSIKSMAVSVDGRQAKLKKEHGTGVLDYQA